MSAQGTPNTEILAARAKKQADIQALERRRDELKAQLDAANAKRLEAIAEARAVLPDYDDVCLRLDRLVRAHKDDEESASAA